MGCEDPEAALAGIAALTPAHLRSLVLIFGTYVDRDPSAFNMARSTLSFGQWRDVCAHLLRQPATGEPLMSLSRLLGTYHAFVSRVRMHSSGGSGRPAQSIGVGGFIALLCDVASLWERQGTPKCAAKGGAAVRNHLLDDRSLLESVRSALQLPVGLPPLLYLLDRMGRSCKLAGELVPNGKHAGTLASQRFMISRQAEQRIARNVNIERVLDCLCLPSKEADSQLQP